MVYILSQTLPLQAQRMHTLFYFHLLAALVHAVSFTLLLQLQVDGQQTYQLSIPYTEHSGSDGISTSYLHYNVFGEFTLLSLLLVNEAITAVSHLSGVLGFGLYKRQMIEDDRHLEVIRRYVEYAITAALLEVVLYVLIGGRDFNLLFAIVVTNVVIQVLGYVLERTANVQRQVYLNLSAFALLLVPILSFVSAGALTEGFLSVSIYYTILYALFGVHSLLYILSAPWRAFIDKDAGYIVLGISAKEILTWMAVALQAKLYEDHGVSIDSLASYVDLDNFIQWTPIGGLCVAAVALVISSRIRIVDAYDTV